MPRFITIEHSNSQMLSRDILFALPNSMKEAGRVFLSHLWTTGSLGIALNLQHQHHLGSC